MSVPAVLAAQTTTTTTTTTTSSTSSNISTTSDHPNHWIASGFVGSNYNNNSASMPGGEVSLLTPPAVEEIACGGASPARSSLPALRQTSTWRTRSSPAMRRRR